MTDTFTVTHTERDRGFRTCITSPEFFNGDSVLRIESTVSMDGKRIATTLTVYTPHDGFFRYKIHPRTIDERRTQARTPVSYRQAVETQHAKHTTPAVILRHLQESKDHDSAMRGLPA